MAASVASRYALGADGVGAACPGARGSRVTASRYALGAEGGGAARPGAYMCPPRNCARCLLGGVGMSKKSCAARCSRGSVQGVLRAPAEGEGGVAHREDLAATASATLERSTGTVAHGKRAARERRRRRSKVSRRRRAGHAPPARRGRRVRVPRAFKRPAKTLWWVGGVVVVRTPTPNYLRQASPDRGKYCFLPKVPRAKYRDRRERAVHSPCGAHEDHLEDHLDVPTHAEHKLAAASERAAAKRGQRQSGARRAQGTPAAE